MARDVDKNVSLYFYDIEDKIFTGEIGSSGDSDNFVLPTGMTPIEPPLFFVAQQATFNETTQEWSVEYINPYDGLTQTEKDSYDEQLAVQAAINTAQQKVIDRLIKTMDKLLEYTANTNPLTATQQLFVDDFRNDYADYVMKRDA